MNIWERENYVVAGLKEKIITVCKRDFELMENQISKIEGEIQYLVIISRKTKDCWRWGSAFENLLN